MTEWNETEARQMREQGKAWTAIGDYFGMAGATVRRRIDPEYDAIRREQTRRRRQENRCAHNERRDNHGLSNVTSGDHRIREDIAARLAEIPQDTRCLTGQVFGDPIPGDPRTPWRPSSRMA